LLIKDQNFDYKIGMILISVFLFPKWYNFVAEGGGETSGTAHSESPCLQAGFWTDEVWDSDKWQWKKSCSAAVLAAKSGCWLVKHLKLKVLIKFFLYLSSVIEDGWRIDLKLYLYYLLLAICQLFFCSISTQFCHLSTFTTKLTLFISYFSATYYTGCPRRKGQNFGRVFLMLKYTDITQNTYIQSWTITEIMAREKCGLLAGLRTVPCQLTAFRMSVLNCRVRLQKYRWRSYVSTPLWLTMHVMYSAWNP